MTNVSAAFSGYSVRMAVRREVRTSTDCTPIGTPGVVIIRNGTQQSQISGSSHIGRPAAPDVEVTGPTPTYMHRHLLHEVWIAG